MLRIANVTIVGGGQMGTGIADTCASLGQFNVTLVEVDEQRLSRARSQLERDIGQRLTVDLAVAVLARIAYTIDLRAAVERADLIIEAIVEIGTVKRELFARIERMCRSECILVSNTSSLCIGELAAGLAPSMRSRFAGLHFFTPVVQSRIVEIVAGAETADETTSQLELLVERFGKVCLRCADTPGFVVNGLLIPLVTTAMRMVQNGVARPADIDRAAQLALGHPVGPLRLADHIGLDVSRDIIRGLAERQPDVAMFADRSLLEAMVERGELGVKSGKGYYDYTDKAKL